MAHKRHWGMDPSQWQTARERLRGLLTEAAVNESTVTYGEAAKRAFDGRFSARSGALMDLLGEVDEDEHAERGVMIASLVVRADTGRPGDGYFMFAREELGRDVGDRERFWLQEARAVWAAYAGERSGRS